MVDLSKDQKAVFDAIIDWVRSTKKQSLLTLGGYGGTGKGQPLDAVVMTPFGPRKMGDIKVGSLVSNPDGTVARVLHVHELGERDVFRVTFSDGDSARVTEDHLWLVKRAGKHLKADRMDMNGNPLWGRIETTSELIRYIRTQNKIERRSMPLVPLTKPVVFTIDNKHRKEPVPPYVLGVLIGDGSLTSPSIRLSSSDPELVSRVEGILKTKFSRVSKYDYGISVNTGVRDALVELGLFGKKSYLKFIPPAYKHGPIETREELVRGLMDTDGTVGQNGDVSFTSTSEKLADDLRWVLSSLGYRARKTNRITTYSSNNVKKSGRRSYTLHIQGRNLSQLFFLDRKRKRCSGFFNGGVSDVARRIVSIRRSGTAVCRCITVDHPNGLYLTDGFIVTHNSTVIGVLAKELPKHLRGPIAYVAYTGRAASILDRKLQAQGVSTTNHMLTSTEDREFVRHYDYKHKTYGGPAFCGTIHKLIYRPVIDRETERLKAWKKRVELDRPYALIVVDEASMVSDEMLKDIDRHGTLILAVGDHGQLAPLYGTGNLMANPRLRLEKIHRQAEKSPIIMLAKHVREGRRLRSFSGWGGAVRMYRRTFRSDVIKARMAIHEPVVEGVLKANTPLDVGVVAWKNSFRVALNRGARVVLGHAGAPKKGEPVICLKNGAPVFNGMRGVFAADVELNKDDPYDCTDAEITFPDDGISSFVCPICVRQFNRQKTFEDLPQMKEAGMDVATMEEAGRLFDFGYAMTCHKAQGSQFKHTIVYLDMEENPDDDRYRRWAYTALSRAVETLAVLV